jgi:hypothetical protein
MDHGAADQFAAEDLEAFLDRLLVGAKPVKTPKGGQVNIPEAARLAFCMSEEVVRLILDGKLARKWASLSGGLRACVLFDHFICAGE